MRIAYVHDRLNTLWWAERVFAEMVNGEWTFGPESALHIPSDSSDERRVFTMMSAYDEFAWLPVTSIGKIKNGKLRWIDPRWLIAHYPLMMRSLSKKIRDYAPDVVYISSFAVAKNIDVDAQKLLYCHSPMQYVWDVHDEYVDTFGRSPLELWKKQFFLATSMMLRKRDVRYTDFAAVYANSAYTQWLLRDIYDIHSELLHPVIDASHNLVETWFEPWSYYLYIGRLVRFSKHVDTIIEASNKTWVKLVVAWTWADETYLKSIAGETVSFIWYIDSKDMKYSLMAGAKAVINITKESFGITTAEAIDLWVPVIWYNAWATPSLVWADGELLADQSVNSLVAALWRFEEKKTS